MVGEDVDVDDLQLVEVGGSTPLRVKNDDIYVRIRYRIFRSVPSLVVALLLIFVIAAFSKSTYGGEHSSNRITNNGQQKIELLEETVSLNNLLAMGGENDWTLYINRSATTTVLNRSTLVVNIHDVVAPTTHYPTAAPNITAWAESLMDDA
jgi:low affinity Fe/Cu permease